MGFFNKIAASVLSLELLLGCEQPQQQAMNVAGNENSQVVEEQINDERPAINVGNVVVVPRLAINEENYWTVRYANEQQGIREMRELAMTSLTEEAWIYLPQFNVWYEVGEPAMVYADETDVNVDTKINASRLLEIVEQNRRIDDIQLWHNHPNSRMVVDAIFQHRRDSGEDVSEKLRRMNYFYAGCDLAMPTIGYRPRDGELRLDLGSYVTLYAMLNRIKPGISFSARVCSDSGVLRFGFTPEGFSRYANMNVSEIKREIGEHYKSTPGVDNPPESLFLQSDEKIEECRNSMITELCRQMCTPYFTMTFVPHQ